jgi:phosphoglycerol transferase MdoB-like AlkP superfamily enzyme
MFKIVIASPRVSCLYRHITSTNVFDLFQASIQPHQLLLSLLLTLVVCYWLLVLLGALDFEADLPDDLGTDGDAHHGSGSSHALGMSTGGAWLSVGRFIGFSQVPLMVWLSFMILFLWFGSLALNEWYNQAGSLVQAIWLLLPNLLGSLIATKLVTFPVAKLFKAMGDADSEAEEVIGRTGIIVSTEADASYGQLEITTASVPLLINVRTEPGVAPLKRGDSATVIAAGPDNIFYLIEPAPQN